MVNALPIQREWAMPNRLTFKVECIKNLLDAEMNGHPIWADPFCGEYSPATIRNDADEAITAQSHLDGLDFLKGLLSDSVDGVLFDPPYSVEQALRSYKPKQGGTAGRLEYQARCADEIARVVKPGGKAICFGWNSNGIGKGRGFKLERILLVNHGAAHNDTIITVERKVQSRFNDDCGPASEISGHKVVR